MKTWLAETGAVHRLDLAPQCPPKCVGWGHQVLILPAGSTAKAQGERRSAGPLPSLGRSASRPAAEPVDVWVRHRIEPMDRSRGSAHLVVRRQLIIGGRFVALPPLLELSTGDGTGPPPPLQVPGDDAPPQLVDRRREAPQGISLPTCPHAPLDDDVPNIRAASIEPASRRAREVFPLPGSPVMTTSRPVTDRPRADAPSQPPVTPGAPALAATCPADCGTPSGRTAGWRSAARTASRSASRHTPPAAPGRSRHRSRRRRRRHPRSDQSTRSRSGERCQTPWG